MQDLTSTSTVRLGMKARRPEPSREQEPDPPEERKGRIRGGGVLRAMLVLLLGVLLLLFVFSLQQEAPPPHASKPSMLALEQHGALRGPAPVQKVAPPLAAVGTASAIARAGELPSPSVVLPVAVRGHEERPPLRVGLLMLIIDNFPPWWPFLVASYRRNHPHFELIAVHTGPKPSVVTGDSHIRFELMNKAKLAQLFATKLSAQLGKARVSPPPSPPNPRALRPCARLTSLPV